MKYNKNILKNDKGKYKIQYIEPIVIKEKTADVIKLNDASETFKLIHDIQDSAKEKFVAIYMNSRNRVLCIEIVHIGGITQSIITIRSVVSMALLVNAVGVIVAHNHPSGETTPSIADKEVTQQLKRVCNSLELALLDHVIIADDKYYSFAEHGLL